MSKVPKTIVGHTLRGAAMVAAAGLLGACGGEATTRISGLQYQGNIAQASIVATDLTDAVATAADAYLSTNLGAAMSSVMGIQRETGDRPHAPYPLTLVKLLEHIPTLIDPTSSSRLAVGIDQQQSVAPGNCGGGGSYGIDIDPVSGLFSGDVTLVGYCDNGAIVTGHLRISGTYDLGRNAFAEVSFGFDDIQFTAGQEGFTADGVITFRPSDRPLVVVMDTLLRAANTGKTYHLQDYRLVLTRGTGYEDVEMTGRFYDPDRGFVVLSTPLALRLYGGNAWPSAGVLNIGGANSMAIVLTAYPDAYQVDIKDHGMVQLTASGNWADL